NEQFGPEIPAQPEETLIRMSISTPENAPPAGLARDIPVAERHHLMTVADETIGELAHRCIEIRTLAAFIEVADKDNAHRLRPPATPA
ncbi:MAG: hypothetical protein LPK88_12690, partial [Alphaproteobacteria bacterium]|nr:hypothetical protein [Alphaproteobacteria bacterium]